MDNSTNESISIAIIISVIMIVLMSFSLWNTKASETLNKSQSHIDQSVMVESRG